MKFSTLNIVFTCLNFAPCIQGILRIGASNLSTLFKILAFGHSNDSSDARRWRHLAYVNALYPMSVAGIGELRFCSQWVFKHALLSCIPLALARLSCWIPRIMICNRVEACLRGAGKSGYYTDDSLPTVAALCEQADEQLFHSIKNMPTYPHRWPLALEHSTPCCTCPRPHNYELSAE